MIDLHIKKVSNGYLVEWQRDPNELHIATTQDEVAAVVKKICRGAFPDGGKEAAVDPTKASAPSNS